MQKLKLKELNSGFELEKNIKGFNRKQKTTIIISCVLIFSFLIVFLSSSLGLFTFESVSARISDTLLGGGKKFPVEIQSENIANIKTIGNKLLIISDKNIVVYNSDGIEDFSAVHTFSKPAVSVNGKYAVAFDRAGKGYILLNEKKIVATGEEESEIVTAEYSKNGDYAFSLKGKESTGVLKVYSKTGKMKFKWECAHENIISIALSESGKFAGVALFGTEKGECYTGIKYFGYSYNKELSSDKITGSVPFNIDFTQNNTLTLFTDSGVYKLNKNADKCETVNSYFNPEFNSFSVLTSGEYVLSLAKYGSTNVFSICLYNGKGKLKKEISLDTEIKSVNVSDKYIFALAENKIFVYNHSGRIVGNIDIDGKIHGIFTTDKYIYIHSLDNIRRTFSYGNSSVSLS